MGVCNCSMFCCTLLYVPSSFAIILMGKRELVALLSLSSLCLVICVWLFLAVSWVCLQFVIVVFPDHTHYFLVYLFLTFALFHTFMYLNVISLVSMLFCPLFQKTKQNFIGLEMRNAPFSLLKIKTLICGNVKKFMMLYNIIF